LRNLKAKDEAKQETIYRKRLQIYQQVIPLLNSRREKIAKTMEEMKASNQDINELQIKDKYFDKKLLNIYHQYGQVLFHLKDFEQSIIWLKQCVDSTKDSLSKLDDAVMDSDDVQTIMLHCTYILEMSEVYKVLKKNEALANYLDVLRIFDIINLKNPSAVPPLQIAGVCNNIAMSYYHQFEYSNTLPYFQRALDIYRAHYGNDIPAVKLIEGNIATNRQMAAITQQMTAQGITIHKMDFTDHRALSPEEEKEKYFSGNNQN